MTKFQVHVSRGGLFVQSAFIEIEANSKEEAEDKAVQKAENCSDEIDWTDDSSNYDNYQAENCEEIKKDHDS